MLDLNRKEMNSLRSGNVKLSNSKTLALKNAYCRHSNLNKRLYTCNMEHVTCKKYEVNQSTRISVKKKKSRYITVAMNRTTIFYWATRTLVRDSAGDRCRWEKRWTRCRDMCHLVLRPSRMRRRMSIRQLCNSRSRLPSGNRSCVCSAAGLRSCRSCWRADASWRCRRTHPPEATRRAERGFAAAQAARRLSGVRAGRRASQRGNPAATPKPHTFPAQNTRKSTSITRAKLKKSEKLPNVKFTAQ